MYSHKMKSGMEMNLQFFATDTPISNPKSFDKSRRNQGYRDAKGNIWKKDKLHKDHWDVSNGKGRKIKKVDFNGRQIWPNGPKNK